MIFNNAVRYSWALGILIPSTAFAQDGAWDWPSTSDATAVSDATAASDAVDTIESRDFWDQDHAAKVRSQVQEEKELIAARERLDREIAAEKARRVQIAKQQEAMRVAQLRQQRAQEEAAKKKKKGGLFSIGKALAMTTGAILGGAGDLDSGSQAKILGGILADSMNGNDGISNMQGAVNGVVASKVGPSRNGSSGSSLSGSVSSGPLMPNILDPGRSKCNDNGQVQAMCQAADVYYNRYVQLHNEGETDPSQVYEIHKMSAKEAMRFMQNSRVQTGLEN